MQELRSDITPDRILKLRSAIVANLSNKQKKYRFHSSTDNSYQRLSDAYEHVFERHSNLKKSSCNQGVCKATFPRRSSLSQGKKNCGGVSKPSRLM